MDKIEKLRLKINEIDQRILDLISERIMLVQEIGKEKKNNSIPVIDKNREEEILRKLKALGKQKGIDSEAVEKIWTELIAISYKVEGKE